MNPQSKPFKTNAPKVVDPVVIADKIKILRRLNEIISAQILAVKDGDFQVLPRYADQKNEVLAKMAHYQWGINEPAMANPDILALHSQAVDLEQQLQKLLENKLRIISADLSRTERRLMVARKTLNPYLKSMGGRVPPPNQHCR